MRGIPIVKISKRFTFDSAHRLTGVAKDHPCGKIHGHAYTLEVEVSGKVDHDTGWLIDYKELKQIVKPLVNKLDHKYLNDIEGIEKATSEELAVWFWNRIKPSLSGLSRVSIFETATTRCDYCGEME